MNLAISMSMEYWRGNLASRELEREGLGFSLDAIVTVIDAINFKGYEDSSYTAKLQAQYTDLIVINKHEAVGERALDDVIDRINDLNTDTPRIKSNNGVVDPALIMGIDTKLFSLTSLSGARDGGANVTHNDHHSREVDVLCVESRVPITKEAMQQLLSTLPIDELYRAKGTFLNISDGRTVLCDHAFGRSTFHDIITESVMQDRIGNNDNNSLSSNPTGPNVVTGGTRVSFVFMGVGLRRHLPRLRAALSVEEGDLFKFSERP
eukprot:Opistho-2@54228